MSPQNTEVSTTAQGQVIRLRLGDQVYGLDVAALNAQIADRMPGFVTGDAQLSGAQQALRSGIKALAPMGLRVMAGDIARMNTAFAAEMGYAPLPIPDLKGRHADWLHYATVYIARLIVALAATQEWQADVEQCGQGVDGYIRITRLSTADRTVAPDAAGGEQQSAGARAAAS